MRPRGTRKPAYLRVQHAPGQAPVWGDPESCLGWGAFSARAACAGWGFLDLKRLQATGTYVGALRRGAFLDPNFLQIRVPAAARRAQRVAARVAEAGLLPAGITNFRHYKSPVLGYQPVCGGGPEAMAEETPSPGSGQRLYQILAEH